MPESRDRITRPEEVAAIFAQRRRTIRGLDIFLDDLEGSLVETPFRWGTTPMTGVLQSPVRVAVVQSPFRRGSLGTPRSTIGRGRENSRPRSLGRGRGHGSLLPSWYPRTPLRDITAVARAIERRRGSLRESEGLNLGTPTPSQDQNIRRLSFAESTPNPQLENSVFPMKTLSLAAGKKPSVGCPPSVAKILLNITSQKDEGENSDCLTPEKKLLNSIDVVGKQVMEELEKMKKTPSAKRAIRERKVRTLMAMR